MESKSRSREACHNMDQLWEGRICPHCRDSQTTLRNRRVTPNAREPSGSRCKTRPAFLGRCLARDCRAANFTFECDGGHPSDPSGAILVGWLVLIGDQVPLALPKTTDTSRLLCEQKETLASSTHLPHQNRSPRSR